MFVQFSSRQNLPSIEFQFAAYVHTDSQGSTSFYSLKVQHWHRDFWKAALDSFLRLHPHGSSKPLASVYVPGVEHNNLIYGFLEGCFSWFWRGFVVDGTSWNTSVQCGGEDYRIFVSCDRFIHYIIYKRIELETFTSAIRKKPVTEQDSCDMLLLWLTGILRHLIPNWLIDDSDKAWSAMKCSPFGRIALDSRWRFYDLLFW